MNLKKMENQVKKNSNLLEKSLTKLIKGNKDKYIVFHNGEHLIADSLTHMGIMPLWPITKPKFNGPFRTGSMGEFGIMILIIIILL